MAKKSKSPPALNQVHHSDCIEGMQNLAPGSVDLVFADPPFNIGFDYDVYDDSRDHSQYLDWSRRWIEAVYQVLKPDGTFWLAIGDEYAAELKVLSRQIGFHSRSWVVWYYTFGVNCKNKFSRSHAHLFHFVKNPERFTFRSDELENRIPSARALVYNDARANPQGRLPDDTWILRPQDLADCFTSQEDTWYFPRVAGTFKERAGFHGCQMPEQLLGRIVRVCSHEDELVLDPFAGSSTTLVVAKKLGRRFVGFDLSADYVKRGTARLAQVRRGDALEGAPEPTMSAPATPKDGKKRVPSKPKANPSADSPGAGAESLESAVARAAQTAADAAAAAAAARHAAFFERGLIEAFRRVNEGYSLDRVLADPELNGRLIATCNEMGLLGDARNWNWRLLNFRKQGKLADVATSRRTEVSWEDCDPYWHGSEIALAVMLEQGAGSVDDILCDPLLAEQFDRLAGQFAPGHSAFEYRWAALKLRKEAKLARSRAGTLTVGRFSDPRPLTRLDWTQIPESAGVYLVSGGDAHGRLYVGESLNLRERLRRQFAEQDCADQYDERRRAWNRFASFDSLTVQVFPAEPRPPELLAYQSRLIGEYQTPLNFKDLAP